MPKRRQNDHVDDHAIEDETKAMPVVDASPQQRAEDGPGDQPEKPAQPLDADGATPLGSDLSGGEGILQRAPLIGIVALNGPQDGLVTLITMGEGLIGRFGSTLTVQLPHDQRVSRIHARISYQGGDWMLEDVTSRNGTWLDDGRTRVTQPITLTPGRPFRVGRTDLALTDDPALLVQHSEHV